MGLTTRPIPPGTGHPYLTPEQVGTGSVAGICTSCGYPYSDRPADDRPCTRKEYHRGG